MQGFEPKDEKDSVGAASGAGESVAESSAPGREVFGSSPITLEVEEAGEENGQSVRRKGIYLIPNLFTTVALFSGFYAIVGSTQGMFESSAIAIFVAMAFDGLDGRVARLTQTQSAFGAQYDSLSDLIAFGLAPALLAYSYSLNQLGKVGWMLAFLYVACTALRLARFNVIAESTDQRFFIGLPSPSAAGWLGAFIWFLVDRGLTGPPLTVLLGIFVTLASILMVANINFRSFKQLDLRGRVPFVVILVVVLVFGLTSIDPPLVLFLIGLVYAFSGPAGLIFEKCFSKEKGKSI